MGQSAAKLSKDNIIGCFKLLEVCPGGHKWKVQCTKCGHITYRTTRDLRSNKNKKDTPKGCELCKSNHHYRVGEIVGPYEILEIPALGNFKVKCTKCGSIYTFKTGTLSYIKANDKQFCTNCTPLEDHGNAKYKPGQIVNNFKLICINPEKHSNWIVECIKCGRRQSLAINNIKKTQQTECYFCQHPDAEYNPKTGKRDHCQILDIDEAIYRKYKSQIEYLNRKGRKQKEFSLTVEEFKKLIHSNCFYCGDKPNNNNYWNTRFKTYKEDICVNGIDRIDSDKGYISGNCVPCCKHCNAMKSDMHTVNFLDKIQKIYDNFSSTTIETRLAEWSRVDSSESKQGDS